MHGVGRRTLTFGAFCHQNDYRLPAFRADGKRYAIADPTHE